MKNLKRKMKNEMFAKSRTEWGGLLEGKSFLKAISPKHEKPAKTNRHRMIFNCL
jgi:hypothetical protein